MGHSPLPDNSLDPAETPSGPADSAKRTRWKTAQVPRRVKDDLFESG